MTIIYYIFSANDLKKNINYAKTMPNTYLLIIIVVSLFII